MSAGALDGRTHQQWVDHFNRQDDPTALLSEALDTFGDRAAIGTSGQLSGVVLIDIAARTGAPFRAFTVDTLRLHPETYALWNRLESRYNFTFEIFRPDAERTAKMIRQHGEYLFFDSKEKQAFCCHVRKVEPNDRALASCDVWITGLRRDQSAHRGTLPQAEIVEQQGRQLLKLNPLVAMTEEAIWQYVRDHDVPYNPLFDVQEDGSRYPSLGCVICTTPVRPHEPLRAGRWRWFNTENADDHKECGIHR